MQFAHALPRSLHLVASHLHLAYKQLSAHTSIQKQDNQKSKSKWNDKAKQKATRQDRLGREMKPIQPANGMTQIIISSMQTALGSELRQVRDFLFGRIARLRQPHQCFLSCMWNPEVPLKDALGQGGRTTNPTIPVNSMRKTSFHFSQAKFQKTLSDICESEVWLLD